MRSKAFAPTTLVEPPVERRRPRAALVVGVLALTLAAGAGCGSAEPGSPAEAYEGLVAALEARDSSALYGMLHDGLQAELSELYQVATACIADVDRYYPAKQRAAAREAAGAGLVGDLAGPAQLFSRLLVPSEPNELSSFQRLGGRISRTNVQGDTAQLTSHAGDVWEMRKAADGSWRWYPPEEDRRAVRDALDRAKANHERIKANVARYELLRDDGVVRILPVDHVSPPADGGPAPDAGASPDARPAADSSDPADAPPSASPDVAAPPPPDAAPPLD